MTGKPTRTARLISETVLELGFPYHGGTNAALFLQQHPRQGLNVLVSINKGQITCSFMGCKVLVRFDDRPPIKFSASQPADHSSTALFLSPESKFLKELKASSRVAIELTFFNQGTHTFLFSSAGLEWN